MPKYLIPYVANIEVRFFPSFFSYRANYITFRVDEYNLLDRIIKIPFLGEFWSVSKDKSEDITYRREQEKLSGIITANFIDLLYKAKLKLNIKIIEVTKQTVVADKYVDTYEEFIKMPYKEIDGHFMFFTIANEANQYVGKSLYTIAKILNDGWHYEKAADINSHIFSKGSRKKLYYIKDKGIKMSLKTLNKILKK